MYMSYLFKWNITNKMTLPQKMTQKLTPNMTPRLTPEMSPTFKTNQLPQGGEATSPGHFPRVGKQCLESNFSKSHLNVWKVTSQNRVPSSGKQLSQFRILVLNSYFVVIPQCTSPGRGHSFPGSDPQVGGTQLP